MTHVTYVTCVRRLRRLLIRAFAGKIIHCKRPSTLVNAILSFLQAAQAIRNALMDEAKTMLAGFGRQLLNFHPNNTVLEVIIQPNVAKLSCLQVCWSKLSWPPAFGYASMTVLADPWNGVWLCETASVASRSECSVLSSLMAASPWDTLGQVQLCNMRKKCHWGSEVMEDQEKWGKNGQYHLYI